MKKMLILLVALLLCTVAAAAETVQPPVVYVSITDDTGALVLAMEPVTATDHDGDGACTIHDALAAAHSVHLEGAAAYSAVETEWGLSLMKLWGVENGGSYGYYHNDAMAMGLLSPVADGDHVKAYVITDLTAFSDTYCYFDTAMPETAPGSEVSLTLMAETFDENFAPVSMPVAGAVLTVDGIPTEAVTDPEGKAVLTFAEPGTYVISANSADVNLVDPVCIVTVK